MVEAGKKFRHLVQFNSGQPTSDFTYTLYGHDGQTVLTETVPIPQGQISYSIDIPAGSNSLSLPLFEQRTLEWEYNTANEAIVDSLNYILHTPMVFPASFRGVRSLLGVDQDELPDEEIDLFNAYMSFRSMVGEDEDLTQYQDGSFSALKITKAIEAVAALEVFPTLQLRLPKKYDSGTSSYERWTTIDWAALESKLTGILSSALLLIDPEYEVLPVIDIFVLSDRPVDATTGV